MRIDKGVTATLFSILVTREGKCGNDAHTLYIKKDPYLRNSLLDQVQAGLEQNILALLTYMCKLDGDLRVYFSSMCSCLTNNGYRMITKSG